MSGVDVADRNYEWFIQNLPNLVKKYDGQFIVIKDEVIVGHYATQKAAYEETIKTERPGTFIIQLCTLDKSKVIQVFHSRVRFG